MSDGVYGAVTGMHDAFLSGDPSFTYFNNQFKLESQNLVKTYVVPFDTVDYRIATIPYFGDFIGDVTIRMKLPGLATPNDNFWTFTNPPAGNMYVYSSTKSLDPILTVTPQNINVNQMKLFNALVPNISVVGSGPNFSLIVDTNNTLTAYGSVQLNAVSNSFTTKKISCGVSHAAFLDVTGNVYTFGDNSKGQLGNGGAPVTGTPVAVATGVVDIECCNYSTIYRDATGNVYATGTNSVGELGSALPPGSFKLSFTQIATELPNGAFIDSIKAGPDFLYLVDNKNSKVYSSGQNNVGQLGRVGTTTAFGQCTFKTSGFNYPICDLEIGYNFACFTSLSSNVTTLLNSTISFPSSICLSTTYLYVVSGSAAIYRINLSTNAVNLYVYGLSSPKSLVNNGNTLYFSDNTGIKTITTAVSNVVTGSYNTLAIDTTNNLLYATSSSAGTISKINLSSNVVSVISSNYVNPQGLAFDSTHNYLYIGSYNLVTQLNLNTGASMTITTSFVYPYTLAMSPKNFLYVGASNVVSKVDLSDLNYRTNKLVTLTNLSTIIVNSNDTLYTTSSNVSTYTVSNSLWIAGNKNIVFLQNTNRDSNVCSVVTNVDSIYTNRYSNTLCYVTRFLDPITGLNTNLSFLSDVGVNITNRVALGNIQSNIFVNNTISPQPNEMPIISIGNFFLCGNLFFGDSTNGSIGSIGYKTQTLMALPSFLNDSFNFSFPFETSQESLSPSSYVSLLFDSIQVANFFGYDYKDLTKISTNSYILSQSSPLYNVNQFLSPQTLRESGFIQGLNYIATSNIYPAYESIVNSVSLYIGKQLVQTIPVEFLEFKKEIATSYKNRPIFNLIEGDGTNQVPFDRYYYIQTDILKNIPIGAITNQDVQIQLDYNQVTGIDMDLVITYIKFDSTPAPNSEYTIVVPSVTSGGTPKGPCTKVFTSNTFTSLKLNGENMFDSNSSNIMPYENFVNIPLRGQSVLFRNPINMSRIRDVSVNAPSSNVYFETLNILKVKNGLAGMLFS